MARLPISAQPPARPAASWRFPRTIGALMLREMATTYGRSPGGYVWALLEPVLALTLLSVVFSYAFRSPSLGNSFVLFYASGYLPFTMFNSVANATARSIRYSRQLLNYPAVTFVDAVVARFTLTVLTELLVAFLITVGILWVFDLHLLMDIPRMIEGMLMLAFCGLGVGLVNCYLMTSFPIWEVGWSILTRPLFIISGLFFLYEDLPRFAQEVLWWNPIFHGIGMVRSGVFSQYHADYVSVVYVMGLSSLLMIMGLLLLYRYNRDLMER